MTLWKKWQVGQFCLATVLNPWWQRLAIHLCSWNPKHIWYPVSESWWRHQLQRPVFLFVPLTQMSFYRDREPWQPWQLNSKYDHLQLVLIFEKNFFSCQAPKRNFRIAVAVSLIFETRKVPKFVFLLLSIRFFHKLVSTCIDDAADLIHSQLLLQFRKFSIIFTYSFWTKFYRMDHKVGITLNCRP